MPVFNTAANQIHAKPVSSFYEGKAMRIALKNQELANEMAEIQIDQAPDVLAIDQQNAATNAQKAQNSADKNQIDLAKLERDAGKDAVDAMIEGFAGGMAVYEETGDPDKAYEATITKLAAMDPNTDPEEARQMLDESMGGAFNPETVGAFLMTADEYRQRGRKTPSAFINFRDPETGEEVSVRTDSPEADEYAEQGWLRIGSTQRNLQSDDPAAFFGGSGDKVQDREARGVVVSAENMLSLIERMKNQVIEMPQSAMGLPGTVAKLVDNTANAVMGFGEFAGGTAMIGDQVVSDSMLLDAKLYQDMFQGPAAQSAALQSNAIGLAYALARAADPSGRLSDFDVRIQMRRINLSGSSKEQIKAAMTEVERTALANTANYLRINGYTKDPDGKAAYDSMMERISKLDSEAVAKAESQGIQTIISDEEWEALPSGAQFYAPDGTLRKKP